ncbi:hypothetical protein C817_04815 [Dorea sp. 5-2]|mgnify:FL=1|nr:hypothetical protein C817_04815 [Dorea sp. 5-2]
MDQTLDEAIYNRYIAPTKRQRTGRVGLEFELPVVNREHAPVDFEVIHKVTDAFLCKFHFQEAGRDDDGFIYAALDGKTGDWFAVIDAVMKEITPENKVNLLLFDGELLYVHTNYRDSLHFLRKKTAVFVSTRPLDKEKWEKVPMNMLLAFESGRCRYTGKPHENEFFDSEEKMRMLFLDYAGL